MSNRDDFNKFNADNPQVFEQLASFGQELVRAGRTHLSISLLVERVRWETAIKTTGDVFKIRNAFSALYARELDRLPEFKGKFRLAKLRSE
jgi:hypothetical protein